MTRWILLLVLVVVQQPKTKPKPAEPLPPLNAKVVEFARNNLGKPCGDGICITLAVEALKNAGAKSSDFREPNGDYVWGEPVPDFKNVLPGDILQFRDAVFRGQRSLGGGRRMIFHAEYPHHTAVVAKSERGGKLITIYHQNVATEGKGDEAKGNVQEGELRMEALQPGGWIKAYRPVPR
jgi:hypothetical protein